MMLISSIMVQESSEGNICTELSNNEIGLIGQPLRLLSLERFEKSSMDLLEHI